VSVLGFLQGIGLRKLSNLVREAMVIISAALIFCLTRQKVKEQFK
jgi:hypothetical protein